MNTFFVKLLAPFIALSHIFSPTSPTLSATNIIPTSVALFETSLASKINSTATSMTLVSGTDNTGTSLASSTYAFILDEGSPNEEMVLADCTGTACGNMIRGISPLTGTSSVVSLQYDHRRGASIKITDGPQIMILSRVLNGSGVIPNLLNYQVSPDYTNASTTALVSLGLLQQTSFAGTVNANDSTKGIVETATVAEASAGTSLGSTGARLALGANLATSTCSIATNSVLVASSTTGKLDAGCMATNGDLTYTGTNTFNASTTFAATTTIAATAANRLSLNGVPYSFPSTVSASGTVATLDGNSNVSFQTPQFSIIYNNPNVNVTSGSGTAMTSFLTVPVPANTLSATVGKLEIEASWLETVNVGGCIANIGFGNGAATTTFAAITIPNLSNTIFHTANIYATSTTSQNIYGTYSVIAAGEDTISGYYAFSPVNVTQQAYISFNQQNLNSSDRCKLISATVKLIK